MKKRASKDCIKILTILIVAVVIISLAGISFASAASNSTDNKGFFESIWDAISKFFSSLAASITGHAGSGTGCAAVPNGLISWWQGENNANDFMGINNGSYSGNYITGMVGQAFESSASVPDSTSLRPAEVSFAMWTISTGATTSIFQKGCGRSGNGFLLSHEVWSGGPFFVYINGGWVGFPAPSGYYDGNWHFMVVTFKQPDVKMYVDGVLMGTRSYNAPINYDGNPLIIGGGCYGGGQSVDEFQIYNRALTDNEVLAEFNAGSAGKCTTPPECGNGAKEGNEECDGTDLGGATCLSIPGGYAGGDLSCNSDCTFNTNECVASVCPNNVAEGDEVCDGDDLRGNDCTTVPGGFVGGDLGCLEGCSAFDTSGCLAPACTPVPSGIISWWQGENNANDIVSENNGVINGATFDPYGRVGSAIRLSDGTSIDIPVSSTLNIGSAFTIDAWIKPDTLSSSAGSYFGLVSKSGVPGDNSYTFLGVVQNDGSIGMYSPSFGGWQFSNPGKVAVGVWTHVAWVYNENTISYYINGVYDSSDSVSPIVDYTTTHTFKIGRWFWAYYDYKGLIDEVEYFNRALNADEINNIYAAGSTGKCPISRECNNSVIETGEDCDPITAPFGISTDCSAFTGKTCSDTCKCVVACGNGVAEGTEVCDLSDLKGESCISQGYGEGSLGCLGDCSNYNYSACGTPSCVDVSNMDLVSWWNGEYSGTTMKDIFDGNSGSGGFINVSGKIGDGYYVDDYRVITIPDSENLNPQQITVDAWINPSQTSLGGERAILFKSDWYNGGYGLHTETGYVCFFVNHYTYNACTPVTSANKWYYVAGTYDGTTIKIYVDGQLKASRAYTGAITRINRPLLIGATSSAGGAGFYGVVDEAEVFSKVLTATEIRAIYLAGMAGVGKCLPTSECNNSIKEPGEGCDPITAPDVSTQCTNANARTCTSNCQCAAYCGNGIKEASEECDGSDLGGASCDGQLACKSDCTFDSTNCNCVNMSEGMQAWWNGQYSGTTAVDIDGENDGTMYNVGITGGKIGNAFNFYYGAITIPDNANIEPAQITVDAWIYPRTSNAYDTILFKSDWYNGGYGMYLTGNERVTFFVNHYTAGAITSTAQLVLNKWSHVAATYDGTNVKIYVNGQLSGSATIGGPMYNNDYPLIIGASTSAGGYGFNGLIDEVELFNRALSLEEIRSIYTAGSKGKCREGGAICGNGIIESEEGEVCDVLGMGDGNNRCFADSGTRCSDDCLSIEDVRNVLETCNNKDDDCEGAIDEGLVQVCGESTTGECTLGFEVCQAGAYIGCTAKFPTAEICDAKDNDCDGTNDEELSGSACGTDVGECQSGILSCINGVGDCIGDVGPSPEVCDNFDNDCNNYIDSFYGPDDCPEGYVAYCSAGSYGDCEQVIVPETCDGIDNDNDGQVDEGLQDVSCGTQAPGICSAGTQSCINGLWTECTGQNPQPEGCNGLDDDCDGVIDDGIVESCDAGGGTPGMRTCIVNGTGTWTQCDLVNPSDEVCDGIDNDQDGTIDDNTIGSGEVCSTGQEGVCAAGLTTCIGGVMDCMPSDPRCGVVCGDGNLGYGEQCEIIGGEWGACCNPQTCQFREESEMYVCRIATELCDVAETCTGASDACPADEFEFPGVVCRENVGICDIVEYCTGISPLCPADAIKSETAACTITPPNAQNHCDGLGGSDEHCVCYQVEESEATCFGGMDEDCDGLVDLNDPDCDFTPPVITNDYTPSETNVSILTLTGTVTDDLSGLASFTIDNISVSVNPTNGYYNHAINLYEGINVITETALDNNGNERTVAKQITLDTKAPMTTKTTTPAAPDGENGWFLNDVSFDVTSKDESNSTVIIISRPESSTVELIAGDGWELYNGVCFVSILHPEAWVSSIGPNEAETLRFFCARPINDQSKAIDFTIVWGPPADPRDLTIYTSSIIVSRTVQPTIQECGNGAVEGTEQCDLGANNGQYGYCCASGCTYQPSSTYCPTTGNNYANHCNGAGACVCNPVQSPETSCSDGYDNDCDGLVDGVDSDCAQPQLCGNGNIDPGEQCDPPGPRACPPGQEGTAYCTSTCQLDTSGCGESCFLGGTKITMADGSYKNIEDVKVGNAVLSYDDVNKQFVTASVIKTFEHSPSEMGSYYLIINNKVKVTPNHPIFANGKSWKQAGQLVIGDVLMNDKGKAEPVYSLQKVYERVPTYNLEIENYHVYFADLLAHNGKPV